MTAPVPSNADELVSAYIDGVAAPDEIALIEGSDELMARVDSMRQVTGWFDQPVTPPSDAIRESHLAAALGEFDRLTANGPVSTADGAVSTAEEDRAQPLHAVPDPVAESMTASAPSPAPESQARESNVTSFAQARERRRPRGFAPVAAAAAVVALLFVGIVAVGLNRSETTDVVSDTIASSQASSDSVDSATDAIESSEAAVLPENDEKADDADDAMDDAEAAMADSASASAPVEAMEEDAMEEAMDETMEEEAESDTAGSVLTERADDDAADAAAPSADAEGTFADDGESVPLGFLGFADTLDALAARTDTDLSGQDPLEIARQRDGFLPASTCSDVILEYAGVEPPTLLATAFVDGREVELHGAPDGVVVIVDRRDCSIVAEFP